VTVVVTQPDRESFLRCRRQWDLQARFRRNLEPSSPAPAPDLGRALRAALAVYYFPGMWDWDRAVTLPLVRQGFDRDLSRQRERGGTAAAGYDWTGPRQAGHEVLSRYFDWARGADRFSPMLIEADFEAQVADPARPRSGLTGPGGDPVRFRGRIDMLAVDENDAYWIVRNRLAGDGWLDTAGLLADDAALAACWAWEQFYPGMTIAGTLYNELRLAPGPVSGGTVPAAAPQPGRRRWPGRPWSGRRRSRPAPGSAGPRLAPEPAGPVVRQHEPSGGGRSIPQHRRMYAQAREPALAAPVVQEESGDFRRTWIRRSPKAIAAAGLRLAADAAAMLSAGPVAEPSPSDANCRPCDFLAPCLAMRAGRDSEFMLRSGYRTRPPDMLEEGRLGGGAWGTGRGAAPLRRG
jgi:hypothetical protein